MSTKDESSGVENPNDKTELFETAPIPRAVMSFAVPMMLGMLVTVVYILADTFFVAQTGDPNQVAAVTICMPVFTLCMALGNIFGVGGASYISRLLGKKDVENAKRVSAFAFYMTLVLGIAAGAIMLSMMDAILPLIGATEQTISFSRGYITWIAGGASVIALSFGLGEILRSVGAAKEAMFGMIAGTALNILLDPILIFSLNLGVVGAAIATIISNTVSTLYFIRIIVKKGYPLSVSLKYFKPDKKLVWGIIAIGIPLSLREILTSVTWMVFNFLGARHGDVFLAAIGIANVILMLPYMAVMGLSQGIQPLLGYTYTANLHERLRGILRFTMLTALGIAALLAALIYFVGGIVVAAFIDNADVISLGQYMLYRIAWSIPLLAVLFVLSTVFQAFGKAKQALVLSVARQGVVFLPVIIIFNIAFGRDGLIFAMPVADALSTLICVGLFLPLMRELGGDNKKYSKARRLGQ